MKSFLVSIFALALVGCSTTNSRSPSSVNRPPQYVMLAFDGSKDLNMWEDTRAFAKEVNAKFTYFISGVYFVYGKDASAYEGPGKKKGRSDIGFGKSAADIKQRLRQMELAVSEGHELASHANGHFNGSKWTEEDWRFEFLQFDNFLAGAYQRNGLQEPKWWNRYFSEFMVGFRAPLLGVSPGLWPALKERGISYDTSRINQPGYWPRVQNGLWNFPLARIQRVGTTHSTLSMDYNFYFAQSGGVQGPEEKWQEYEDEMYKSYLAYFRKNYAGNRAPVHIGHHFSLWNGGAYWRAMKRFAKDVCNLPEVRCATYRELMEYMASVSPEVDQLQAGKFQKVSADEIFAVLPQAMSISLKDEKDLNDSELFQFLNYLTTEQGKIHEE